LAVENLIYGTKLGAFRQRLGGSYPEKSKRRADWSNIALILSALAPRQARVMHAPSSHNTSCHHHLSRPRQYSDGFRERSSAACTLPSAGKHRCQWIHQARPPGTNSGCDYVSSVRTLVSRPLNPTCYCAFKHSRT
jgi:hypothetical protein